MGLTNDDKSNAPRHFYVQDIRHCRQTCLGWQVWMWFCRGHTPSIKGSIRWKCAQKCVPKRCLLAPGCIQISIFQAEWFIDRQRIHGVVMSNTIHWHSATWPILRTVIYYGTHQRTSERLIHNEWWTIPLFILLSRSSCFQYPIFKELYLQTRGNLFSIGNRKQ